jgi:hypothetical protein
VKFTFLIITSIVFINRSLSQDTCDKSVSLLVGYSKNLIIPTHISNYQLKSNDINFGFLLKRNLSQNNNFNLGFSYCQLNINDYSNTVIYVEKNLPVKLTTSIKQKQLCIDYLFEHKINKSFTCLFGIRISYLLNVAIEQHLAEETGDSILANKFHNRFDLVKSDYSAPFSRVNFGPSIGINLRISKNIFLRNSLSYDLISNPRNNFPIEFYNILRTNFSLIFKR